MMRKKSYFSAVKTTFLVCLVLLSLGAASLHAQPWIQKGSDILGESIHDFVGGSVDMSADGMTIVVASPGHSGPDGTADNMGQVRVFQFDGFRSWSQRGSSIYGDRVNDQMATSVSMSADGNTFAVGTAYNDGADSSKISAGQVKVYQWNGSDWVQMGTSLYGLSAGDLFGYSVSLSSKGLSIAIGAPNDAESYPDAGQVRVYKFDGSDWTMKGYALLGKGVGEHSGYSVSLSSDGSVVAIGAYMHEQESGLVAGQTRVFLWDNDAWSQRGTDLDGDTHEDMFGISVSLNGDGDHLAVGASGFDVGADLFAGQVKVYRWNLTAWTQLGAAITGDGAHQYFGASVSLDRDGNTLAVGAEGSVSTRGYLRLFEWEDPWTTLGDKIFGKEVYDGFGHGTQIGDAGMNFITASNQANGYVRVYGTCDSNGTDTQIACDAHTWIDGVTYTESNNTATWTLQNAAGCDSLVTLNLTILKSSTRNDVVTACDTYTWLDGVTYTESNNSATWTLQNAIGCDSVISLDLTVLVSTASTIDETAVDTYTSPGGKVWTESGTYRDTIDNAAGCDSVITINLSLQHTGIPSSGHEGVKFYPNPVEEVLSIEFEQEFSGTLEILDMNGRLVLSERRSGSFVTSVQTSALRPGFYIIKLMGQNRNYRFRISKE